MSDKLCLSIVRNIPSSFHSSDLRGYFSQFIEAKGFLCFHYKHRPEVIKTHNEKSVKSEQTNVCIVQFNDEEKQQQCMKMYNSKNWVDKHGTYLKEKCKISKFSISSKSEKEESLNELLYLTQSERKYRKRHAEDELFSFNDLLKISELNPPVKVMPNGNVGTPISIFQDLIKQCLLPTSVIKSLGLTFPKSGSNRRYGRVPMNYGFDTINSIVPNAQVETRDGSLMIDSKEKEIISTFNSNNSNLNKKLNEPQTRLDESSSPILEGDSSSDVDEDTGEEWERHEAFHDDVTSQERSKERLFEEEIELKWEKGGSGLVFYTDAQYWAKEDGDFDEQTTDDWDVDMSGYYGEDGDKDAIDFIQILKEKRFREGKELKGVSSKKRNKHDVSGRIGGFEKHTKGFGRRIMERMGWKDDQNLGPRKGGLLEPLVAEGQSSRDKVGFGYRGEKLQRSRSDRRGEDPCTSKRGEDPCTSKKIEVRDGSKPPRHISVEPLASHSYLFPQFRSNLVALHEGYEPMDQVRRRKTVPGVDGIVITTIYDDPLEVDQDSGMLRSQHPTGLKRRSLDIPHEGHSSPTSRNTGSKLVKLTTQSKALPSMSEASSEPTSTHHTAITLGAIKFVRPSHPSERFV